MNHSEENGSLHFLTSYPVNLTLSKFVERLLKRNNCFCNSAALIACCLKQQLMAYWGQNSPHLLLSNSKKSTNVLSWTGFRLEKFTLSTCIIRLLYPTWIGSFEKTSQRMICNNFESPYTLLKMLYKKSSANVDIMINSNKTKPRASWLHAFVLQRTDLTKLPIQVSILVIFGIY